MSKHYPGSPDAGAITWQVNLEVAPGQDPLERVIATLRVRGVLLKRLEYVRSTPSIRGSMALQIHVPEGTVEQKMRFVEQIIGVLSLSYRPLGGLG